jgi:hypothetical protein
MTFNQGAFVDRVKSWDSDLLYSVDLSAATDRFPISVISLVLRGHLPKVFVDAWEDIMIGYPFLFRRKDRSTEVINYSVGNPMGFYSSWASFALAHHYIFYYIARTLGKDFSSLKYVLLGDDVLIGDKDVGELYLDIIRSLGVDVSLAKTHISPFLCEFAKRWIFKGQEISPFPVSALHNSGKRYYLLTNLMKETVAKGWRFDVNKMVGSYFGYFKSMPSRFRKNMEMKSTLIDNLLDVIHGIRPASHLSVVWRKFKLTDAIASNASVNYMLAESCKDLFIKSDPRNSQSEKSLGLLSESILLAITGHLEQDPEVWDLLENPILHSQGNIEQSYLDSLKLIKQSDESSELWPFILKNMAIPQSDSIFIDRSGDSVLVGSSKVANLLWDKFKALPPYEAPIFRLAAPG